ncbi:MAG TPA: pyruvate:ferredoxin (flavodoxin) oxidoreductase, partial [Bacteroidetes bacterium]|nr:pyruvate:ferredoxin (flavodoxin) oxidoreductase [Bacteroidota bacterium]
NNSLFEDNAEYVFGMALVVNKMRNRIAEKMQQIVSGDFSAELKEACNLWLTGKDNAHLSKEASAKVIPLLEATKADIAKELLALKQYFIKKSVWMFGGDGWAYDIGYGGLDHVLASGENVNVLVLDTEVYSNTGGQMSKSTPRGAVAKFAAGGKPRAKKDLGLLAMTYGNVYVAAVAMGSNDMQTIRAFLEAEAYDGPSIILAYSHCIAHGINMTTGMVNQKAAVDSGHWPLGRYNPMLLKEGKNPLKLDSKAPKIKFSDYAYLETRYKMLTKSDPEAAKQLMVLAQEDVNRRWEVLEEMAKEGNGASTKPAPQVSHN